MNNGAQLALMQLLPQAPSLLVCLIGAVLALVWWRRSPLPAGLALAGAVLLLLDGLVAALLFGTLMSYREREHWTVTQLGGAMTALGVVGGLVRSLGLGLLLAAAFTGRHAGRPDAAP